METNKKMLPLLDDWGFVPLEHLVEIHDTLRRPVKATERVTGTIPYCGANGIIDYVDGFTHEGEFVMLAEDGGFFKPGEKSTYIMSGRFWANNHVHVLRAADERILAAYLHHYLNYTDLRPFLTGATRPKLTQGAMCGIPVLLPYPDDPARSLETQRRIVARIEALFAELRECRKLHDEIVADTGRVMEAAVSLVLDDGIRDNWEWTTVGSLMLGKPQYGTSQKPNSARRGVPILRMGNIQDGELDLADLKHVDLPETEVKKYRLQNGDLVFNRTNSAELVGKTAVFESDEPTVCASYLIRFRVDLKRVAPRFVSLYINSPLGRKYVESQLVRAIGQVNVNAQKLSAMPIPIPSVRSDQDKVVEYIQRMKQEVLEIRSAQAADATLFDDLEQVILAQAFRGEL